MRYAGQKQYRGNNEAVSFVETACVLHGRYREVLIFPCWE